MAFTEPIVHADMDAFFVEVERLRDPSLRDRPVVVGGRGPRSVVAAASYEARTFGVVSAMPSIEARRRCPQLIIVPPDHAEYGRVSEEVFRIFRSFTPMVEGLSVDEAFLDVGGLRLHYPSSTSVAEAIRQRVRQELDLPCSVGVAATKFVAKLASVRAKPDGLFRVAAEDTTSFLHGLPVAEMWGVGRATEAALAGLGIETVGDLAATPNRTLQRVVGPGIAGHLLRLAAGIDERAVEPDVAAKSVSVEETVDRDLVSLDEVLVKLRWQADEVTRRLRRGGHVAKTVTVKLRTTDFVTVTRAESLAQPTDVDVEVFAVAARLARSAFRPTAPLRLIGIGLSHLSERDTPTQLSVKHDRRWSDVTKAADEIRERFGERSLGPAGSGRGREKTSRADDSRDP